MSLVLNFLGRTGLKQVEKYVNEEPEKGLKTLLNFVQKLPLEQEMKEKLALARQALEDRNNNWHKLVKRLFDEIDPRFRERLITNMLLNAWFLGVPKQRKNAEKYGINIPFALLIDPTAKCNLRCTGCWAGDYDKKGELDYETLDRIIGEARDLGIYFTLFSGGEPLLRKDDIFKLAAKYNDMAFHAYTNGILIDRKVAEEAKDLGNFGFAISLEGFRENTDARRGKGTFDKIMEAMDALKEAGVIFGFSVTYTRNNTEEIGSEKFIDFMISKGCTFGWYFTYIPIGADENLRLMATPEQRAFMYKQIRHFRKTKPIAVFDFWNDGMLTNGCIAGGRRYLHINASGEVEPCAFVHFSSCNIKEMSLLEALKNPLFKAYQKRQPFNSNMLRPCPIIDNPDALPEMVAEANAYPTQQIHWNDPVALAEKLHNYAKSWGDIADALQKEEKPVRLKTHSA